MPAVWQGLQPSERHLDRGFVNLNLDPKLPTVVSVSRLDNLIKECIPKPVATWGLVHEASIHSGSCVGVSERFACS